MSVMGRSFRNPLDGGNSGGAPQRGGDPPAHASHCLPCCTPRRWGRARARPYLIDAEEKHRDEDRDDHRRRVRIREGREPGVGRARSPRHRHHRDRRAGGRAPRRGPAAHGREARHHVGRRHQGGGLGHRRADQQRGRRARPGRWPTCRSIGCATCSRSTCSERSRSPSRCCRGMVAKGAGRVIIVSSIAGVVVGPSFGPYSMTKHALEAMGKAMRAELARAGHRRHAAEPRPVPHRLQRPDGRLDVGVVRRRVAQRAGHTAVPDDARLRHQRARWIRPRS